MLETAMDTKGKISELFLGLTVFLWAFHILIMNFFGFYSAHFTDFSLQFLLMYMISLGVLTSAGSLSYSIRYRNLILGVNYYSWVFLASMCTLTGGPFYFIYAYVFFAIFSAFLGLRLKCRRVW